MSEYEQILLAACVFSSLVNIITLFCIFKLSDKIHNIELERLEYRLDSIINSIQKR